MGRLLRFVLPLVVLAGGAWFSWQKLKIQGLEKVQVQVVDGAKPVSHEADLPRSEASIRIASFNIRVFGQTKMKDPKVMQTLCDVVSRFDLVAIQEIRSKQQDVLPRFVEQINTSGRKFDYVIGPRVGRIAGLEQYAYIFDTERIEVDPRTVYTVVDPDDRIQREPLVASFRARGPPPEQAFTFTLVNMHTDPDVPALHQELDALAEVWHAVRRDRPAEDDVIMLGDFNADDRQLRLLGQIPYIMPAIVGQPTNARQTELYDNLLFHQQATREYRGVSGVLNLMEEYQLSLEEVLLVSDHFPVWAEFSVYEGGEAPIVATRPADAVR